MIMYVNICGPEWESENRRSEGSHVCVLPPGLRKRARDPPQQPSAHADIDSGGVLLKKGQGCRFLFLESLGGDWEKGGRNEEDSKGSNGTHSPPAK